MTDAPPPGVSAPAPEADLSAQLVEAILTKSHPLVAEALYFACVPHSFSVELLKALRGVDDGKDKKLVERLAKFSFIREAEASTGASPHYSVTAAERDLILRRFIAANHSGFIETHRRALADRELHPHPDPVVQAQSHLYHTLVINGSEGIEFLARMFSKYTDERRLAATERLIATAAEIQPYLAALGADWAPELDYWVRYLRARSAQLRGSHQDTIGELKALLDDPRLPYSPALVGRIHRAYGRALADQGLYVEAIQQHHIALTTFKRQAESDAEQGYTMLNVGDAYVDLAASARGQRDYVPPKLSGWRDWLTRLGSLFGSLPLIIYLQFIFGLHWNPRAWATLAGQDWVIARLFGAGARWYRRANAVLIPLGRLADPIQADEKLAHLYLTMGDAASALPAFQRLLAEKETPLSEYRRARVRAGLGQTLLRLGQSAAALEHLQAARPVLVAYSDTQLEAQTRALIAEAQLDLGHDTEAMPEFDQALRLYQKQEDIIGATELAERLQVLENDRRTTTATRESASTTTKLLSRRHYLLRFQHPTLVFFRRAAVVFIFAIIFLVPLLTTRVEIGSATIANVNFYAAPLLENNADYSPSLTQSVTSQVGPVFEVHPAVWLALSIVLVGFIVYAILGVAVIATTPLRTVQEAQAGATRFDMQALAVGLGETLHLIEWPEVTRFIRADTYVLGVPNLDNSSIVIVTPEDRVVVRGHTAWYSSLATRIQATVKFTAKKPRVVDLSYDLVHSPAGYLFIFILAGLITFTTLGLIAPALLVAPLPLLLYSAADLYPYFLVGLLLPPMWWFIAQPIWIHTQLYPRHRWLWWIGGLALVGTLFPVGIFLRPLFVIADMVPALALFLALGAVLVSVWTARDLKPVYPLPVRLLASVVLLAGCAVNISAVVQSVSVYHQLVIGNHWRDEGLAQQAEGHTPQASRWFAAALQAYDPVLRYSPGHVRTLTSRAAVEAQLGQYAAAIADYTRALARTDLPDQIYSSRAIAYTSWAGALAASGQAAAATEKLVAALADFDQALAVNPQPNYYLLRGVTYHRLGQPELALADYDRALDLDPANAQALAGEGWVYFAQADQLSQSAATATGDAQIQLQNQAQETFRHALTSFDSATRADPNAASLWLALGYAHFRLKEYDSTLTAWDQAVKNAPEDPVMLASRGTAHWRLASPTGGDRCASSRFTAAEKDTATLQLRLAVDDFTRALAFDGDNAVTYRTRAQVQYLLRFCPGFDFQTQLRAAIGDYGQAVKYAPDNFLFWQFKARLEYVLGLNIFANERDHEKEARAILDTALSDIKLAFAFAPADADNQAWRAFIVDGAEGNYYLARGEKAYAAGDYRLALSDFENATQLLTPDPQAAFKAGLAALALADSDHAAALYRLGLQRVTALPADQAKNLLQAAIDDLTALVTAKPELGPTAQPILDELKTKLGG